MTNLDRRHFLGNAARGACLFGAAPFLGKLQMLNEAALDGGRTAGTYKALVCLYLGGGNDSHNLLVPNGGQDYADYALARDVLAVPQGSILPITPVTNTGRTWGLHPNAAELQTLFAAGKLAFIANVGPLVQPMTRAQYRSGSVPRPKNLFSHSDQTTLWQSQSSQSATSHGWAGRMADFVLGLNHGSPLSPAITLAGSSKLLRGQTVMPFAMSTNGTVSLTSTSGTDGARRLASFQAVLAQSHGHAMERAFADMRTEAIALDDQIRTALAAAPALATVFPNTSIGRQLRMVARMIGIRVPLGVERQVFFTNQGGYDTHDNQLAAHPILLGELGAAMAAFQAAMAELGAETEVTLFTLSEFGRTLTTNGRGSDHGWGSVQMALGGAVLGRDLYGTMPSFVLNSNDDADGGRMIPTTAVEQYAAVLASWFGVAPVDLATVFPRLSNFAGSNLGFL